MKFKDWLDVVFPRYCLVCGKSVFEAYENFLCIACFANLPLFIFSIEAANNPIIKTFWGRCAVSYGGALLVYQSGSPYSQLFKEIKYRDRPDLGRYLGYSLGLQMRKRHAEALAEIDVWIPVPMTRKKLASRGYNQAVCIAEGMQSSLGICLELNALERIKDRGSQTRKSRIERWLNAKSVYVCAPLAAHVKHVALIDDVLTTGATIEACVEAIRMKNDVKISVFALGYTES
jgi:ComF family protein